MKLHLVFIPLVLINYGCKKDTIKILEKSMNKVSKIEIIEQQIAINYQDLLNHYWHNDTVNNYFIFRKDNTYGSRYHTDKRNIPIDFEMFKFYKNNVKQIATIDITLDVYGRLLAALLSDSTIKLTRLNDTIIENHNCYSLKATLIDKTITDKYSIKEVSCFIPNIDNYKEEHFLRIKKSNYLPIQILKKTYYLKGNGDLDVGTETKSTMVKYIKKPKRPDSLYIITNAPQNFIFISNEIIQKRLEEYNLSFIGKRAPEWVLKSSTGNVYKSEDFKDKTYLFDFYWHGCGPCIKIIPHLNNLYEKYKNSDFNIFGINTISENKEDIDSYINKFNIDYTVLVDGQKVREDFNVYSFPTLILIKNDTVLYRSSGYNSNIEKEIVKLIANR